MHLELSLEMVLISLSIKRDMVQRVIAVENDLTRSFALCHESDIASGATREGRLSFVVDFELTVFDLREGHLLE